MHVTYVVVDAVIDLEWTRKRYPDRPDDFFIKPRAIADEIRHMSFTIRSAWSYTLTCGHLEEDSRGVESGESGSIQQA